MRLAALSPEKYLTAECLYDQGKVLVKDLLLLDKTKEEIFVVQGTPVPCSLEKINEFIHS